MIDLKLHTPAGLNDITPLAYARRRAAERHIEAVFERYAYAFISSPALEYISVFEGKGSVPPSRMYTLNDAHGDRLALRPDMTPPAARIAATNKSLGLSEGPLRLCYIEKTFRNHARYQGKSGEFMQAGIELMGVCSPEADAEVIAVAADSLLATGLTDFRIDIGQVDFLRGVLADSGLDETRRHVLSQFMIERDYVAVEKIMTEPGTAVSEGAYAVLTELTRWTGGPDMLESAEKYASHPISQAALKHLREVYAILCDQGLGSYVLFDLSMTGHLDYYTGIIFRGYARGTGYALVDGGRYDNLLAQFGKPSPAVGFGLRLDGLLDVLGCDPDTFIHQKAETLLAYAPEGRAAALMTADALRRQGVMIENSLLGNDITANINYAKQRQMGGILYFVDSKKVRLFDLVNDKDMTVPIDSTADWFHNNLDL